MFNRIPNGYFNKILANFKIHLKLVQDQIQKKTVKINKITFIYHQMFILMKINAKLF